MKKIKSTKQEIQSGEDRVRWAEGLILQLPMNHDGRNSWLINYGTSSFAKKLRANRKLLWDKKHRACAGKEEFL